MFYEKVGVDQGVSYNEKWPKQNKLNKVGKFISSANSKTLGVNPDHSKLVKKHFGVNKGPHNNLNRKKEDRHCEKNRRISCQQ